MNVLIAYASKYGSVQRVSEAIYQKLDSPTTLINLRGSSTPNLSGFDVVVIGGSIYAGRILSAVPRFVERNREQLLKRTAILFISCLYEGEKGEQQLREAFPAWLLAHASGAHNVGGEIILQKLRFLERLVIRKLAKVDEDIRKIDDQAIENIARDIRAVSNNS